MLYTLICTDKTPDGLDIRLANRPAHLAFLDSLGSALKLAGPFLDQDSGKPTGSLVIIEAESIDEARTIAALDPYAKAGVFEKVEIRALKWLLPQEVE